LSKGHFLNVKTQVWPRTSKSNFYSNSRKFQILFCENGGAMDISFILLHKFRANDSTGNGGFKQSKTLCQLLPAPFTIEC
jgi:hypothetical protein